MANLSKKYRVQGMENESYDEDYGLLKRALYGWDSSGSQYVPIAVDGSGNVKLDTTILDTVYVRQDGTTDLDASPQWAITDGTNDIMNWDDNFASSLFTGFTSTGTQIYNSNTGNKYGEIAFGDNGAGTTAAVWGIDTSVDSMSAGGFFVLNGALSPQAILWNTGLQLGDNGSGLFNATAGGSIKTYDGAQADASLEHDATGYNLRIRDASGNLRVNLSQGTSPQFNTLNPTVDISENLAVGTSIDTDWIAKIDRTLTASASETGALLQNMQYSTGTATTVYGKKGSAIVTGGTVSSLYGDFTEASWNTTSNATNVYGVEYAAFNNNASATVTNLIAAKFRAQADGGTTTKIIGGQFEAWDNTGNTVDNAFGITANTFNGVYTNAYGIKTNAQGAAGSGTGYGGYFEATDTDFTNNYGIYAKASGATNNWAGRFESAYVHVGDAGAVDNKGDGWCYAEEGFEVPTGGKIYSAGTIDFTPGGNTTTYWGRMTHASNYFELSAVGDADAELWFTCNSYNYEFSGSSGLNSTFTIKSSSNSGVYNWIYASDYFRFDDDVLLNSTEKLYFNDTSSYIYDDATSLRVFSASIQLENTANQYVTIAPVTIGGAGDVMAFEFTSTGFAAGAYFGGFKDALVLVENNVSPRLLFANSDATVSGQIELDEANGRLLTTVDLTVGPGENNDPSIWFNGDTNVGQLQWMEDEDYFKVADDLLINSAEKIHLRDTAIGIYSQADTFLDLFADGSVRIGDSSAGAPTNYVEIESDADVNFVADAGLQFGEIYYNGAGFDTALAAQDTFYQLTGFDTNGESNGSVTPDHTNDHITIGKAGRYLLSYSISCRSVQSNDFEFELKYNNGATDITNSHTHRATANVNALGVVATTCIWDVPASATIELWVQRTDGGAVSKTITIEHVNIVATQIGGTT